MIVDCFRCFGHNGPISGSAVRWEGVKNVVLGCLDDVDFANEHSDAFQYGTLVDQHPTDLFIHKNHIFAPVNARSYQFGGVQRSTQGVFGNHNGSGQQVTGEVSKNFILISAFWAIYIDAGSNVQVSKNTIVNDMISTFLYDTEEPRLLFKASSVSCVCSDNIGGNIAAEAGAGVVFFPSNMDTLDGQALAGGNAYAAVFAGPFGFEAGRGATFVIDTTDAATTRADIDTVFAPLPGGAGNGKGHLA